MAIAAIYWAYSTTNIYRSPGPVRDCIVWLWMSLFQDPYGDELLRIERLEKEQEEREMSEAEPSSHKTGRR